MQQSLFTGHVSAQASQIPRLFIVYYYGMSKRANASYSKFTRTAILIFLFPLHVVQNVNYIIVLTFCQLCKSLIQTNFGGCYFL